MKNILHNKLIVWKIVSREKTLVFEENCPDKCYESVLKSITEQPLINLYLVKIFGSKKGCLWTQKFAQKLTT